ncbi:aminoglycoside phosphotransferase family protein [Phenylobacterium sp.]|uniref:aminoglycoside phosphotransferase family protein n=1 Tax=Phenylobacterium sp. TaxID=1871053 RepID=UPI0035B27510
MGGAAEAWLATLPATIADLAQGWGLRLGATLEGGSSAYVAEAVTAAGAAAVLKITMPGDEPVESEIRALALADGHGYARLLAADPARRALLVERLGAPLADLGWPRERALEALAATLMASWRPLPHADGLLSLPDKAAWLARFIPQTWEALRRPCRAAVVERAVAYAEQRGRVHDPAKAVLLHGDPHIHNALADPHEPGRFRLIDPDGIWGEPAYDIGALLRGGSEALLAGDPATLGRARCARMAALTGQPEDAIWAWAFVERVSTALYAWKLGAADDGRRMLEVAEAWTAAAA